MNKPSELSGRLLAHNTLLNFIGLAVPLLIGVVTIPFIIQGLGTERFGLLSLAWVILGYFTIFDLGLGRATTKYVAEALGKGEEEKVPYLVWTSVTVQIILGVMGAIVLVGITPLLTERIMKIPLALMQEAKNTLYLLALAIPVVLVSGSFLGVLEAKQRFDLVNAVRVPSYILTYLLPLLGLFLGFHLPGIVALKLVARFGALSATVVLVFRIFPKIRKFSATFVLFPRLFAYGGWVTVTNVIGPVFVYLDRFLIASLLSVAAVAYYTAPYEVVTRLGIIPASLAMALFPAFSALEGVRDRQRLGTLFARSVKYTLLVLSPLVLVLGLFAKDVLKVWVGNDFATHSRVAMQILALGILVNSLAYIPYALLQGVGRPDITAKLHLLELPFYVGVAWLLVSHWGIAGAAVAWTVRVALDALLLCMAAFKICQLSPRLFLSSGLTNAGLALLLLVGATYGLKRLTGGLPLFAQSLFFVGLISLFAWLVWKRGLDASDRGVVLKLVKRRQKSRNIS